MYFLLPSVNWSFISIIFAKFDQFQKVTVYSVLKEHILISVLNQNHQISKNIFEIEKIKENTNVFDGWCRLFGLFSLQSTLILNPNQ